MQAEHASINLQTKGKLKMNYTKHETLFFYLTIILFTLFGIFAQAQEPRYLHQSKEITKHEALKILLLEPKARVEKCHIQELSPKVTLRNKKKGKK
jgi:hypothetical protein